MWTKTGITKISQSLAAETKILCTSKIISDDDDDVIPGRGMFPYEKDRGAHRNLKKNAYEIPRSGFVGMHLIFFLP